MRYTRFGRARKPAALLAAVLGAALWLIPASGASASSTSSSSSYHPVYQYAQYIGGSGKANPSLSPIDVGVVNEQGGPADIAPEWTIGATVAASYINDQAGGIDGHPIKLVTCFIPDTVSSATQCGQEMANSKSVQTISVGAVGVGNQALEGAILPTKKPIIFGVAISPVDTEYKYGYVLFGDSIHVEAPIATFAKQYLHVKSVSIVWPNQPGESIGVQIIVDALEHEGVSAANIHSVSFDPSTSDLTTPIEAADVGKTSLFIADAAGGPPCSNMYLALKQLNIKTTVLANVPCDSTQVQTADGGTLPKGWYYASANPLPGDSSDPSLAAFKAVATKYGEGQWAADAWVADSFAQMITIAKFDSELLKAHKAVTAANVNALAKAFHGPVPQGAPSLNCGGFPQAPAVCNDKVSFFQNTSPGVFHPLVYFLGPPAGFTIPRSLLG